MKKIISCLILILVLGFVPHGFSHAELTSMILITNSTQQPVTVVGLEPTTNNNESKKELAIIGMHPVIFALVVLIVSLMSIVASLTYQENIHVLRNINKTNHKRN